MVLAALAGFSRALAQEEAAPPPSPFQPSLTASGESVWTLSYGFGDAAALAGRPSISAQHLGFEQQLRLRLSGQAAPGVTVSADLDNVRSENLQLIGIDLQWERARAHLGDIRLSSESRYAVTQAALKGLSLTADLGSWQLSALVGRAQGIPATKTFTGRSSEETLWLLERLPAGQPPYAPTRQPYGLVASLHGVQGLALRVPHDPDFTRVWLRPYDFPAGGSPAGDPSRPPAPPDGCTLPPAPTERSLQRLLQDYQLGPLYFTLSGGEADSPPGSAALSGVLRPWNPQDPEADEPSRAFFALRPGQAVGVNTPEVPNGTPGRAYVLFALESLDLLRAHVEDLIRRFNEQNGLTGDNRLRYPWVRGSATEQEFLTLLAAYYSVQAGSGSHPQAPDFSAASDEVPLAAVRTCSLFREQLGGTGEAQLASAGAQQPGGAGVMADASVARSAAAPAGAVRQEAPFYLLGQSGIEADSLTVRARHRTTGSLRDAAELGLDWDLLSEAGVLRVRFGEGGLAEFLQEFEGLVVRYRFAGSEGVYALGTSVAAGSERVFLNGQRQQRDLDYIIDYESGLLMFLKPVGPSDELRVDFEYFRGGLGMATEYHRNTFGLAARWNPPDVPMRFSAEVFFEGDEPRPLVEPERARTMPNAHTVAAVSLGFGRALFAELDLAYSHDVFPFDDNRRANQPNDVQAMSGGLHPRAAGGTEPATLVLVGHRAGLTVGFGSDPFPAAEPPGGGAWRWATFTTAAGLSGLAVLDVAGAWAGSSSDQAVGARKAMEGPPTAWLVGTESGLTLVANRLPGGAPDAALPFEYADNWVRRYTSDGLPANAVQAVLFVGLKTRPPDAAASGGEPEATVWVGTSNGLAWAPAAQLAGPEGPLTLSDLLREWHALDLADVAPGEVPARPASAEMQVWDLAFAPYECGSRECNRADVIAATSAGLIRVPVGLAAGAPAFLQGPPELTRVDAIAAVPAGEGAVRLYAGGPEGLWARDLHSTQLGDGGPAGGGPGAAGSGASGSISRGAGVGQWVAVRDTAGRSVQGVWDLQLVHAGGEAGGGAGAGRAVLWVSSGRGPGVVEDAGQAPADRLAVRLVDIPSNGLPGAGTSSLRWTALGVAPLPDGRGLQLWAGVRQDPMAVGSDEDGAGGSQGGLALVVMDAFGAGEPQVVLPGKEPDLPGLVAEDPARFTDVPAAQHTRTGLAGRLAAGYTWDGGRVQAAVERIEPGFLPINGILRQDIQRWSASARQRLTPALEVALEHGDETVRPVEAPAPTSPAQAGPAPGSTTPPTTFGRQARRVNDELTAEWRLPLPAVAAWASPPALRARLASERLRAEAPQPSDGRVPEEQETLTQALTLRQELWERRVTVEAGYENIRYHDRTAPSRSFQAHNLLTDVRLALAEGVQATLRYRRPLKLLGSATGPAVAEPPRVEGSQSLDLVATARRRLGQLDAILELGEQRSDRLSLAGQTPDRLARRATATLSLRSVAAGAWSFSPSTRLTWSYTEASRSLEQRTGAQASLQGRWEAAAIDVALTLGRELADAVLPSRRLLTRDTLRLTAGAGQWALLRPELTVEQSDEHAEALLGADRREARTLRRSASLRAVWKGPDAWPQETQLTGRWSQGPAEAEGSRELQLSHRIGLESAGPWSLSASVSARAGERAAEGHPSTPFWQAELSAGVGYRLSSIWQAALEAGWVTGTPSAGWWASGEPPPAGEQGGQPVVRGGWMRMVVRARL